MRLSSETAWSNGCEWAYEGPDDVERRNQVMCGKGGKFRGARNREWEGVRKRMEAIEEPGENLKQCVKNGNLQGIACVECRTVCVEAMDKLEQRGRKCGGTVAIMHQIETHSEKIKLRRIVRRQSGTQVRVCSVGAGGSASWLSNGNA